MPNQHTNIILNCSWFNHLPQVAATPGGHVPQRTHYEGCACQKTCQGVYVSAAIVQAQACFYVVLAKSPAFIQLEQQHKGAPYVPIFARCCRSARQLC